MKMNEFAAEVHQNAVEHGWWDRPVSFAEIIVMCHSELSEAVEQYRHEMPMLYFPCNAGHLCVDDMLPEKGLACGSRVIDREHPEIACKARSKEPNGMAVELADCVLRILDFFGEEQSDLDSLIARVQEVIPKPSKAKDFAELVCGCHFLLSSAYSLEKIPYMQNRAMERLAACIVDILDWAEISGVDMEMILGLKHQYNKSRSYRHGGKML